MKTVKIGMVQSLVVFDAAKENLARSAEGVRLAASKGARICVLPECGDLGWANDHAPELAQPVPGCISGHFSALARETGVWIAAGMTEKDGNIFITPPCCLTPPAPSACVTGKSTSSRMWRACIPRA